MLTEDEIEQTMVDTLANQSDDFDILDKEKRKDFIIEAMTDLIKTDDDFVLKGIDGAKINWEMSKNTILSKKELELMVEEYNERIGDFVLEMVKVKTEKWAFSFAPSVFKERFG